MRATRGVIALATTVGVLAASFLAGAAPVWQGFHVHP